MKYNYKLTQDQKYQIIDKYENGMKICDIANEYRIDSSSISKLLSRRNITKYSRSHINRRYQINEKFFDNIDSEIKAYFLGILYADGCNVSNSNAIKLSLRESDREILEKLKSFVTPNKPLTYLLTKNCENQYALIICSKYMSEKLAQLGCQPKKSLILEFPDWLDSNLISHFIRGYFDGDGYLSCVRATNNWKFSILGTEQFCKSIQMILQNKLNIKSSIYKQKNIWELRTNGNKQTRKIMDWLYCDSNYYLVRKYNKYLQFKQDYS